MRTRAPAMGRPWVSVTRPVTRSASWLGVVGVGFPVGPGVWVGGHDGGGDEGGGGDEVSPQATRNETVRRKRTARIGSSVRGAEKMPTVRRVAHDASASDGGGRLEVRRPSPQPSPRFRRERV
jgi:hypothetical protein